MSDTPIPTPKPKNLWPSSSAPTKVFDFNNDSADQPADQRRVDSLEADIKEMKALMAEQVATQAAQQDLVVSLLAELTDKKKNKKKSKSGRRPGGKSGHKKSGNSDPSDPSDSDNSDPSDSDNSDNPDSDKSDLSDHSDSDLSDSDKSNSDRPPTGRSFDELMALYDLNLLDSGQCKTSSSRYTPTGVLLGAWHHKMHPAARDELHASVIHPGPVAMKGLAVYKAALRAALQPAACTSSMLILHSLSRGNDTLRDHTDNLTAIACASKHMKQLRRTIKSVREEGDYDTDLIPSGAITGSKSFWRFDPLQCDRASQWWDALLELHEAYWGSPAALSWDDTEAESAWLATDLGGVFEQGDSSASDLVSAEGVNYKRRETAEQDRNFCTLAFRRKNLLAASRKEISGPSATPRVGVAQTLVGKIYP